MLCYNQVSVKYGVKYCVKTFDINHKVFRQNMSLMIYFQVTVLYLNARIINIYHIASENKHKQKDTLPFILTLSLILRHVDREFR